VAVVNRKTDPTKTKEWLDRVFPRECVVPLLRPETADAPTSESNTRGKIQHQNPTPEAKSNTRIQHQGQNPTPESNTRAEIQHQNPTPEAKSNTRIQHQGRNPTPESNTRGKIQHQNPTPEAKSNTRIRHRFSGEMATEGRGEGRLDMEKIVHTVRQKRVWEYLSSQKVLQASNEEISEKTGCSLGCVRDCLRLFASCGLIIKSASQDRSKRVRIEVVTTVADAECPAPSDTCGVGFCPSLDRQIEDLSICQKLLDLTSEEIQFYWPSLSALGFGPDQLSAIFASLERIGKSGERVRDGLDHAEWECATGGIRQKPGADPIRKPLGYIFRALATTGYFRRPEGYVSAEEQALRDAEAEIEALQARRSRIETARAELQAQEEQQRYEAWKAALTEDQKLAIVEKHAPAGQSAFRIPREAALQLAWKAKNGIDGDMAKNPLEKKGGE